ncbi:hypothetical protein C2E23DRAFT_837108 [Lenzites betulinus]|nr:hypothetical protein C2E23DRAFT_837108 [Lenzites betulinus]
MSCTGKAHGLRGGVLRCPLRSPAAQRYALSCTPSLSRCSDCASSNAHTRTCSSRHGQATEQGRRAAW